MKNPCIVEAKKFKVIFVMGQSSENNLLTFHLLLISNNTWTDISADFDFHGTEVTLKYSCSMLEFSNVIVSFVNNDGYICSAYYNLEYLSWTKIGHCMGNAKNIKLLGSRDENFVTLMATHEANTSSIYQVFPIGGYLFSCFNLITFL